MKTSANSRKAARRAKSTVSKAKTAVRMTKTTKAGNDTSAQLKAVLNKTAYSPLITENVLVSVSKTVSAIDRALSSERKTSVNLGGLLLKLKGEFSVQVRKETYRVLSDKKVSWAFHHFIRVRFKLQKSRTDELIRLAERKDLHGIELPVSALVELSRLDEGKLEEFLAEHPVDDLQELPVSKIKKLVRGENTNKRERGSEKKPEKTPEEIAKSLKTTFEVVRDKFDESPTIDKEVDSVLGEISKWYIDKKVA